MEVMSVEVLVESVRAVAGAQSWRQRIPNVRRCVAQKGLNKL